MEQRILMPLDGSRVSEAALPFVEKLITMLKPEVKVEVTLMSVITSMRHWVVVGDTSAPVAYTTDEMKSIEKHITDYLVRAGETLKDKGATVNFVVTIGNEAEEILKTAEDIKADIITMSTHGRSGVRRLAFGSVTDKVLRGANVPVITVRAPADTVND